ncbi:hypothetical protein B0H14DRAFT_3470128 [Mycena olivaceomarginata]|nr:hypothetical protein B0H14DRAFT_3470128 [Mycena olivaceomarginata]
MANVKEVLQVHLTEIIVPILVPPLMTMFGIQTLGHSTEQDLEILVKFPPEEIP